MRILGGGPGYLGGVGGIGGGIWSIWGGSVFGRGGILRGGNGSFWALGTFWGSCEVFCGAAGVKGSLGMSKFICVISPRLPAAPPHFGVYWAVATATRGGISILTTSSAALCASMPCSVRGGPPKFWRGWGRVGHGKG